MIASAPLGHSLRRYANTAAVIESDFEPEAMLALFHAMEEAFGRQRRGRAWSARTLDLDIVLWSGGAFTADRLVIPHPHFRTRDFVLGPARCIAGTWRDPLTGLTIRQLFSRLRR